MRFFKLLPMILMLCFLIIAGCTGMEFKPVSSCIVAVPQADGKTQDVPLEAFCADPTRDSMICQVSAQKNLDPCILHRALELTVKEVLVFETAKKDDMLALAADAKSRVKAGLRWDDLKYLLIVFIKDFNSMAGKQLIILSDTFVQIPGSEMLKADDVILVVSSIDDLVQEIERLSVFLSEVGYRILC